MSIVEAAPSPLIEGITEMSDLYGTVLTVQDQRFYKGHDSALRCALRYPSDVSLEDQTRDRYFPPRVDLDVDPETELGNLAVEIESLRDAKTKISFERGVILETCGLLEGYFLETLDDLATKTIGKPEPVPYLFPAVMVVDNDGKPIALRKTVQARTTLMVDGIDEETKALAGAVVKLSERDGHDLTYAEGKSTRNPDLVVVTLKGLEKVVVDRYSTFKVSPQFVENSNYGNGTTRVTLDSVRDKVNYIAKTAGV